MAVAWEKRVMAKGDNPFYQIELYPPLAPLEQQEYLHGW